MRLSICAVGRMRAGPQRTLCEDYVKRARGLGKVLGFSGPDIREISESRQASAAARLREEGEALARAAADGARVILLDEKGKTVTSKDFARLLGEWNDEGVRDCHIWIGGADGHGAPARERADAAVSFGRVTWPHLLVRVMACEQVYRAMTLLSGHPYHRA